MVRTIWKRVLSMTLVLTMLFGMFPISVLAQEPEHTCAHVAEVTAPTCTADGFTTYTCECGDTYTAEPVAAPGHSWGEWSEAEGVMTRSCAACGATEQKAAEPAVDEAVAAVQALIDVLPLEAASEEAAAALKAQLDAVDAAMAALSAEQQAQLNTGRLTAARGAYSAWVEQSYVNKGGKPEVDPAVAEIQAQINALSVLPATTEAEVEILEAAWYAVQDAILPYGDSWEAIGAIFDLTAYFDAEARLNAFWLGDNEPEEQTTYARTIKYDGDGIEIYQETDNSYTLEVLDSSTNKDELYNAFKSVMVAPSGVGRGYRITGGTGNSAVDTITQYNYSGVTLYAGTIVVQRGYKTSAIGTSYDSDTTFTVRIYHDVALSVQGQGTVTIGGVNYTAPYSDTVRVYTTNMAVSAAADAANGYTETTITGTAFAAAEGSTTAGSITGSGDMSVIFAQGYGKFTSSLASLPSIDGTVMSGAEVSAVAATHSITIPCPDFANGYYIASVTIGGTEIPLTDANFTEGNGAATVSYSLAKDTTADITATYAQRVLTGKNAEVGVNAYYSSPYTIPLVNVEGTWWDQDEYAANLTKDKFFVSAEGDGDQSTIQLQMNYTTISLSGRESKWGTLDSIDAVGKQASYDPPVCTKSVKLVWPGNNRYPTVESQVLTATIKESRPATAINVPASLSFALAEAPADFAAVIKAELAKTSSITVTPNAFSSVTSVDFSNVTVNADSASFPEGEGKSVTFDVTVSLAESAGYLAAADVTVSVTLRNITDVNGNGAHDPEEAHYDVTWTWAVNEETTKTYTVEDVLVDTTVPAYDEAANGAPTKDSDVQYDYSWDKTWTLSQGTVTDGKIKSDLIYTPNFTETLRSYTLTFQKDNGDLITTLTVPYGTEAADIVGVPAVPAKAATAEFTYTAKEWPLVKVTGDKTYTASYEAAKNSYLITFQDETGNVLQSSEWEYGTTPIYNKEQNGEPTKLNPEVGKTYTWTGWEPALGEVTGTQVYTAKFTGETNTYTITYKWYEGKETTETVGHGETAPVVTASRSADEGVWDFVAWQDAEGNVFDFTTAITGPITLTAEWARSYYVSFDLNGGSVVGGVADLKVAEGETPDAKAYPVPTYAGHVFKFWSLDGATEATLGAMTGDKTLKAVWGVDRNENGVEDNTEYRVVVYTDGVADVVFADRSFDTNSNGQKLLDGDATPAFGVVPAREGWLFDGWKPAVAEKVSGNAGYTAQWLADTNKNGVADKNETVTVDIEGPGSVTINDTKFTADGSYVYDSNNNTNTIVATPDDTKADDGSVGYVVSATSDAVFTNGMTVSAVFDTVSIPLKATFDSISINKKQAESANAAALGSTLRSDILEAVGLEPTGNYEVSAKVGFEGYNVSVVISDGENGEASKAIVTGETSVLTSWLNGRDAAAALAYELRNENSFRDITITQPANGIVPAVSKTVTLTIGDTRPTPVIVLTGSGEFTAETDGELKAQAKALVTVNGQSVAADDETVTVTADKFPAEGEENISVVLTVAVADTTACQPGSETFTVLVTNPDYKSTLSVEDEDEEFYVYIDNGERNVTEDEPEFAGPWAAGTYPMEVHTESENAYIAAVYVNGQAVTDGVYNNGSYYFNYTMENAATAAEANKYVVSADIVERKIAERHENDSTYTVTLTDTVKADLEGSVFNAVVDLTESVYAPVAEDDFVYEISGDKLEAKEGEYEITITFPGNMVEEDTTTLQYPAVSVTVTVILSNDRSDITVPTIGTVEIVEKMDEVEAAVIKAFKSANAALAEVEITATVDAEAVLVKQGESATYTVAVTVPQTETTNAYSDEITVDVTGKVQNATVELVCGENGSMDMAATADADDRIAAGKYTVTMTPADKYHASELLVKLDGEEVGKYVHADIKDGKEIEILDGTGRDLGKVPAYEITGTFALTEIKIEGEKETLKYYPGQTVADINSEVLSVLEPEYAPAALEDYAEVYYLARSAGSYPYSVTLDLGLFVRSFDLNIPMPELWLNIGDEFPTELTEPKQSDIEKMVETVLEKYSITDLLGKSEAELKEIFKDELMAIDEYAAFYTYFNAHPFGKLETETVKIETADKSETEKCPYGTVTSNTYELKLLDERTPTSITFNDGVEMTYGFSEAELLAALVPVVMADGAAVSGTVKIDTNVENLPAADEAYTIKLSYAGDSTYKYAEAEATITVKRASVSVQVDNRLIKWQEGLSYALPVVTTPADVDTITFIAGLDVSGVNYDGGIKGIMGEVQLMIPESLNSILASVGISNGVSMSISELTEALLKASEALGYVDSDNEVVSVLLNMLESLPTDVADITIRIGGSLPTNIGVYLVGAVTADANYETNFGVGAVVIYPDGRKVDLDWAMEDTNGIITRTLLTSGYYDMGAVVTNAYEGSIEEAQSQVINLFFGVDVDGNIVLETDQTKLNVGAFGEVSFIANWGNNMYYAVPIVRAFVVIAEELSVTFVDAQGENKDRLFTFNNEPHAMEDVLVTYKNGDVVLDTRVSGNDGNLKIYYAGAQTNGKLVLGEEAPVHAGAYTAVALYTLRDANNMVSHVGLGTAVMAIEPTESSIDVVNKAVEYSGSPVTTADMVSASSAVAGLTPDTTVITAGITTDGTFTENGLGAVVGTVNMDLPRWLDDVMAEYGLLEKAYTTEGISKETFVGYMSKIKEALAELNISVDALDGIESILGQLPANASITFKNQSEVAPSNVGAYLVIGVVTDSDHYPSIDAGILVIYPKATEVELKFNEDWNDNNIFTWDYLQTYDLNAGAYDLSGEYNAEATAEVTNLYLGVTDDGVITLTRDKAKLDVGVYTQTAFLLDDPNSTLYYAKPISRVFVIAPNMAKVEFVDETGAVNDERFFTFNNEPQTMDVRVTVNGEVVAEPGDALSIRYVGMQTNLKPYNSSEVPVHAGTYAVTAIYQTRDAQDRLHYFGMGVGTMVIQPAESTTEVENRVHEYDGQAVAVRDMVSASSAVAGITPDTTVISAAVNTDGSFSENGLAAITGSVNVDFPRWLETYVANNDRLADGVTVTGALSVLEALKAELADHEVELESLEAAIAVLKQLPSSVTLTFTDNISYANVGAYLVIAAVTDSDHYPSMDAGMLVIHPALAEAELKWKYEDSNNIFQLQTLTEKKVDMGADAWDGEELLALDPVELFLGVDANTWEIILTDDQTKLEIGAYAEFALLLDINSTIYYAKPLSRSFLVVPGTVQVDFVDETGAVNNDRIFTYTGEKQPMPVAVTENGNEVDTSKGELSVYYNGVQSNGKIYTGSAAPVHVGAYQVTASYVEYDADGKLAKFGMGVGAMVIEPAEADVAVESMAVPTGTVVSPSEMVIVSGVNGETPDSTVISGQLATDGSFSENGLSAMQGAVNVDFPSWLDAYLQKIPVLNDGYESSINGKTFVSKAQTVKSSLDEMGVDSSVLDGIVDMLVGIPEGVELTFKDRSEISYTNIGAYLVVGVVTDSDYYPTMDAGVLVIHPNVELGELQWKNVDSNNIFYLKALTPNYLDAEYTKNGVINSTLNPTEIYLGVDEENWSIHLSKTQPDTVGIYTEIAWLNDTDGDAHYALPILRPVMIIDGIYPVQFLDENSNVNHERLFTYNGEAQPIGTIYIYGQGFDETAIPAEDELKVLYTGIDASGKVWKSSMAPANAGAYSVVAIYTDYDENGKVIGGGAGVGAMVIQLADLALDMKDTTVTYNGEGQFIDVTSTNEKADYLTVIVDRKQNTVNFILEDDLTIIGGAVKTLLEEALGRTLDNEFSVTTVAAALDKVINELQSVQLPEEISAIVGKLPTEMQDAIDELKALKTQLETALETVRSELPATGTVIFNGELPVNVGEYEFYGFAITSNYYPEATEGILTIEPAKVTVTMDSFDLALNAVIPELTYTIEGLVEGDTITVTPSCDITDTSVVGEYVVTAEVSEDPNYEITVVDGKITVTDKRSEVTIETTGTEVPNDFTDGLSLEEVLKALGLTVKNADEKDLLADCTVTVYDENGREVTDLSTLEPGKIYTIVVEYPGDTANKPAEKKISFTVTDERSEVTIETAENEITLKSDELTEEKILEALGLTVKNADEKDLLADCTVTVYDENGNEVTDLSTLEPGKTYTIKVEYPGDAKNKPATKTFDFTLTVEDDHEGEYAIDLSGNDLGVGPGSIVEVDGVSYIVDEDSTIWVKEKDHKIVVTYKYGESTSTIEPKYEGGNGPHYVYPTNMYVWYLTFTEGEDGAKGEYKADRISELDNFLTYKGTSIRMTGNQGIRIFTAVNSAARSSLIKGQLISNEAMKGYKLVEYGTLFQWLETGGDLVHDPNRNNRSIAYSAKTGYDAVFSRQGSDIWFTGMLVNLQLERCDDELQLRPYMILESPDGEQIVIHGGTLQRTIGYVALQNRDYKPNAAAANFIWNIIRAVYGKDFKYPA